MPVIQGNLLDYRLQPLTVVNEPTLVFEAEQPSASGRNLLNTRPVVANLDLATGAFTVTLESTEATSPPTVYRARITWLEPGGNYKSVDVLRALKVPREGGWIGEIAALDYDPTSVWVAASPPTNPAISTWWLDTTTGDLHEWM